MAPLILRREVAADHDAARATHAAAFPTPEGADEPIEADLLDALRTCEGWVPALSWVAELDGRIVGHAVATRSPEAGIGLGPIAVRPDLQRSGVGSALMHAMIGAADALDEPFIALLGDPVYYRRFGFAASSELGIDPPDPAWGHYFQALPLSSWDPAFARPFTYAAPFDDL